MDFENIFNDELDNEPLSDLLHIGIKHFTLITNIQ